MHVTSETQRLSLSPATCSRFTTVMVQAYSLDDLQELLRQQLHALLCKASANSKERLATPKEADCLLQVLLSLKSALEDELLVTVDVRQLLRCVHFISNHVTEPSLLVRLLVGFRWCVVDVFEANAEKQRLLIENWFQQVSQQGQHQPQQRHQDLALVSSSYKFLLSKAAGTRAALDEKLLDLAIIAFEPPDEHDWTLNPGALLQMLPTGHVKLAYTGVAAPVAPAPLEGSPVSSPISERLQLSCTPSLVANMARVFAAHTIKGPLLLEGGPGIGKTAVVQQVAKLLGHSCERINLSANTTVEQLLGSYVPKVAGGQRVFAWQDGVLVRAIRQGKWLLLDEINLAPPEVLAAIAPLLDRWVDSLQQVEYTSMTVPRLLHIVSSWLQGSATSQLTVVFN